MDAKDNKSVEKKQSVWQAVKNFFSRAKNSAKDDKKASVPVENDRKALNQKPHSVENDRKALNQKPYKRMTKEERTRQMLAAAQTRILNKELKKIKTCIAEIKQLNEQEDKLNNIMEQQEADASNQKNTINQDFDLMISKMDLITSEIDAIVFDDDDTLSVTSQENEMIDQDEAVSVTSQENEMIDQDETVEIDLQDMNQNFAQQAENSQQQTGVTLQDIAKQAEIMVDLTRQTGECLVHIKKFQEAYEKLIAVYEGQPLETKAIKSRCAQVNSYLQEVEKLLRVKNKEVVTDQEVEDELDRILATVQQENNTHTNNGGGAGSKEKALNQQQGQPLQGQQPVYGLQSGSTNQPAMNDRLQNDMSSALPGNVHTTNLQGVASNKDLNQNKPSTGRII